MNDPARTSPGATTAPDAEPATPEPPTFTGSRIGTGLDQLASRSTPRTVARVITAPALTRKILESEPGFGRMTEQTLVTAANTLAFLFEHARVWTLLWAKSIGGPGHFEQSESVTYGISAEQSLELARKAGMKATAEGGVKVVKLTGELSGEWSKLTRATFRAEAQRDASTTLSYDIPIGGMDIALWRLDSRLSRRIVIRPGQELPPEPLPHWVELAVAARTSEVVIPTGITRAMSRCTGEP